ALMIDLEALAPQHHGEAWRAKAPSLHSELAEPAAQPFVVGTLLLIPDRRSGNSHCPARAAFAHGVLLRRIANHLPLGGRAHHFFEFTSLRIWMSRAWSATMRLSLRFSSSSCLSRRASLISMPPNLPFQAKKVLGLIP